MALWQKLNDDVKNALKQKNELLLSTLRMIISALKYEKIKLQKEELTDEDCLKILMSEAKKRRDSISAYEKGNRQDLADKEKAELILIEQYLPKQLSEAELRIKIEEIINNNPDLAFGPLMGKVMAGVKGQADGKIVQQILKQIKNP